jgi:hypothetical protein
MIDKSRMRFVVLTALALMAAAAGTTFAAQFRPLPAFTVVAPDGRDVPSSSLTSEARWVLVYVKPDAAATSRLLKALAEWRLAPEQVRRIVLVVEGRRDQVAAFIAAKWATENGDLMWYADAGGEAASALGLTGAPALKGVRAGAIEWALEGVLNDPAAFESVVRTWIGAAPIGW